MKLSKVKQTRWFGDLEGSFNQNRQRQNNKKRHKLTCQIDDVVDDHSWEATRLQSILLLLGIVTVFAEVTDHLHFARIQLVGKKTQ